MPILKTWAVTHPAYWAPEEAREFMQDIHGQTLGFLTPALTAVGPRRLTTVLLGVIMSIARANPVYVSDIQGELANTYDLLTQMNAAPIEKGTKH